MGHCVHLHSTSRNRHIRRDRNRQARRRPARATLQLEALEDRALPSTGPLGPLVQVSSSVTPFTDTSDVPGHFGVAFLNSAVEPRLAVDPNNPLHMVGVWQQDRWSDGASRGIMAGISTDGGNTWTLTPVTGMSINEGGDTQRASDPWVAFGADGAVYVSALVGDDPELVTPKGIYVSKSVDGGFHWGAPTKVIVNTDFFNLFNDKPAMTTDPTNPNNIYVVWDRVDFFQGTEPTLFSRSTDGGQTWSTPTTIFDPGFIGATTSNQIVVLPNGTLVDMFAEFDFFGTFIKVMRSTDQGVTWSAPSVVSPFNEAFEFDPNTFFPVRAGGVPDIAVNRTNGNLYVVFQSSAFSQFSAVDGIALTSSTDGGLTWSTPIQVNQTPTNIPLFDQQAFTPNVAVANNGKVAVSYTDFRFNTGGPDLLTDQWLDIFGPSDLKNGKPAQEFRLTNASFNMEAAPVAGGLFLGDYESLVAGGTNFNSFGAFFAVANTPEFTPGSNSLGNPSNIFFRDSTVNDQSVSTSMAAAASVRTSGQSVSSARLVVNTGGVSDSTLNLARTVANEQAVTSTDHASRNAALTAAHQARPDDDVFLSTFWLDELSTDLI
jgi:hypothetical protein